MSENNHPIQRSNTCQRAGPIQYLNPPRFTVRHTSDPGPNRRRTSEPSPKPYARSRE